MRCCLVIGVLLTLPFYIAAQTCPSLATNGTNGSKDCVFLTWDVAPSPFPPSINFQGSDYPLYSTSGTTGEYKLSGSNCGGVSPTPTTGNVTIGTNTCTYVAGVLPVIFADLGIKNDDGAIIYWSTASEVNNDFFSVERSRDGINFESLGTVEGKGTSQQLNTYQYLDPKPYSGRSYYRIVQYDYDGSSQVSDLIPFLYFDSTESIFYRRDQENIIVNIKTGTARYILRNMSGQVSSIGILHDGENMITTTGFPKGIYVITIHDQQIRNEKVLIY